MSHYDATRFASMRGHSETQETCDQIIIIFNRSNGLLMYFTVNLCLYYYMCVTTL